MNKENVSSALEPNPSLPCVNLIVFHLICVWRGSTDKGEPDTQHERQMGIGQQQHDSSNSEPDMIPLQFNYVFMYV